MALIAAAGALALVGSPGTAHADAIRNQQWHLNYLDIAQAHEISRGEGVTVAVLDTGVDHRHPDLTGAVLEGRSLSGGRIDGRSDGTGHGTAMASLIAGGGHGPGHRSGVLGIAPESKILPVRVSGSGNANANPTAMERGIEWAVDHDADIINISLSGIDDPYVEEAIQYAQDNNVVVVAGAGNTTNGDDQVTFPARYPGVVAVSGTDQDGNFTDSSVSGPRVAVSAPATDIVAGGTGERGRYAAGTGTSDASAITAGTAALIKAAHPDLNADNIINRLIATTDDRGPQGRDPEYGHGIIDPVAALKDDLPKVNRNPLLQAAGEPPDSPSGGSSATRSDAGGQGWPMILGATVALAAVVLALTMRRGRHRRAAETQRLHLDTQKASSTRKTGVRPPAPPNS